MDKNKQTITPYSEQPIKKTLKNQNYDELSKEESKFEDPLFPPTLDSIYSQSKDLQKYTEPQVPKFVVKKQKPKILPQYGLSKLDKDQYSWKRITDEYNTNSINILNVSDNHPLHEDIIQGELGDSYFLSALAALSENKERIKKLFPKEKIDKNGLFQAEVYIHGDPTKVLIDDYIPFKTKNIDDKNNNQSNTNNSDEITDIAFAKINKDSNNLWPVILEKVWAKCNLSYEDIVSGNSAEALEFLTPAPIETYYHKMQIENLFDIIKENLNKNYIILADSTNLTNTKLDNLTKIGFIPNHSYSVLEVTIAHPKINTEVKLLKLKNLWGTNEWLGDWSEDSSKWTKQVREELNYENGNINNERIFWISFDDFLKFYTCTHICKINDNYNYNVKKFDADNNSNFNIYTFNISKSSNGFIIMNMKNSRIYKNLKGLNSYENPFCSVILFKKVNNDFIYIGSTSGRNNRLHIQFDNLDKGNYYIIVTFPKFKDKNNITEQFENITFEKKFSFRLAAYASTNIEINDLDENAKKDFENYYINLISKMANANENDKYYFTKEGEKDSWRAIKYDDDSQSGFGYIYYENNSDCFIREKLTVNELQNVNIIPMLKNNSEGFNLDNAKDKIENEVEYDDKLTRSLMNNLKKNLKLESSINIISNKIPYIIQINIAPHSNGFIMLQKTDEDTAIDLDSDICLDYLPIALMNDEKFKSKKFMLKYQEKPVEIYECVTEHNTGVLFQYKNKTNDLKVEINIKFSNISNLYLSLLSDDCNNSKDKVLNIRTCEKGKFRDDSKSNEVDLSVFPGETKFFEIKAIDVFEKFKYKCNINYLFNLTRKLRDDVSQQGNQ